MRRSDAICNALQLINFWQDVAGLGSAIYLPQDDMARFGVSEADRCIGGRQLACTDGLEVQRARTMMLDGAIPRALPGRVGWELRLIVQGGLRILESIEAGPRCVPPSPGAGQNRRAAPRLARCNDRQSA